MNRNNGIQTYDGDEHGWIGEPRPSSAGPQGAALILELQRLRSGFDRPDVDEFSRKGRGRQRTGSGKRRKGTIGRAIDVCLVQLGLNAAAPVEPRSRPAGYRNGSAQRRPNPGRAPDGPTPMDIMSGRAPERFDRDNGPAPRRRRGPTIASGDPTPMDIMSGRVPAAAPTRRPGPAPAPDHRATLDIPSRAPERPLRDDRHPPAAAPRLALSPPSRTDTAMVRSDRALQRSDSAYLPARPVETLRDRLSGGVAFLVNSGGLAYIESPGDALSVGVGHAFQHELRTGLRVLIAGVVLLGGWAGLVPLAGAVVVPGNLVVQSNVKAIQHPTGGIIAEIAVNNGARVEAGQLLVRLDATQARSSLQVVSKQLDDFRVRMARLIAERDGLDQPEMSPEIAARASEPGIKALMASEQSLFNARVKARQNQKELLQSRVAQLGEQISGLDSQIKSKADQLQLIAGELTGVQDLYDKRLVPLTRLTTLQRESARIDGERGQLLSSIAETKAKVGEAQLSMVKIDQDFRTDVVKELNDVQGKANELVERGVAAKDTLDRIELRAPTSGIVNQLNVHTIGGVIRPGDTIMEVVPDSDDLQIEARVQPKDIDEVRVGQKAFVAFSALNSRVAPKLLGEVSYVSADTSRDKDQQAGGPAFTVRVMIPEEERRRLEGARLVSGMPAELFMQTGSHTMLSYLFKPITEQLGRAFVER